jgi:hypothetical protein
MSIFDPVLGARGVPFRSITGDTLFAAFSYTTDAIEVGECSNLTAIIAGNGTETGGADSVTIDIDQSIDGENWEPFTTGYAAADSLTLRDFDAYRIIRVPLVTDAVGGAGVGWTGSAPNRYLRITVTNAADSSATATTPDTLVNLSVGVFGVCK